MVGRPYEGRVWWSIRPAEGPETDDVRAPAGAGVAVAQNLPGTRKRLLRQRVLGEESPKIIDLGGKRRLFLPGNPAEKVGGQAPHLF